jgi:Ca2+-binding RTX toxin-like protein
MSLHLTGATINPDYLDIDTAAPVANNDSATIAAGQTAVLDVLRNDSDANVELGDDTSMMVSEYTDPLVNGQVMGALTYAGGKFSYTADDPAFDSGAHTVTFQYRAVDQWGRESDSWATVTVNVTGNATPGETLSGLNHPNSLSGKGGNDSILGGNQDDTLSGAGGADTLDGGNGQDSLLGGAGSDLLRGGNGKDTLDGGSGNDTLTGGNSPDVFVVGADAGHVTITDFDIHNETIRVSGFLFGGYNDLLAHAANDGHGNVVIATDDGLHAITLLGVGKSQLGAGEFVFF